MTEQEAGKLKTRLTRIWVSQENLHKEIKCYQNTANFHFKTDLSLDVRFQFSLLPTRGYNVTLVSKELIFLRYWQMVGTATEIGFPQRFSSSSPQDFTAQLKQLADEWLALLRRGCWLSGCPIEASAHEKIEWIQGFTREELEAWNLKM